MSFGSPKVAPAQLPVAPNLPDASVQSAGTEASRQAQAAGGIQSTILTGAQGLKTPENLGFKNLLGD